MAKGASALRKLLSSENSREIIQFLGSRGRLAHIIAPEWVRRRVLGNGSGTEKASASWSQEFVPNHNPAASKKNFIVLAENAAEEMSILGSLRGRDGVQAYGLFHHVLPAILSGMNGMAGGLADAGIKRYALICIPRSGSRYLAAVLSNHGIGAPKEHLRDPLVSVITEGGLGFVPAISALERFGQRNGVFGTKLISTFLIKASHNRMTEIEANVSGLLERGYGFIRLERPLEETAVSSYIAFLMKKWHFFGELDEKSRAKLDSLEFEPGAAWEEYIRLRAEQIIMRTLALPAGLPTIQYSEIESDVDGVVRRICRILHVEQENRSSGSIRTPTATRSESPTYSRFATRLEEVVHKRRDEMETSTIMKLQKMASLSSKRAEQLAADASARVNGSD